MSNHLLFLALSLAAFASSEVLIQSPIFQPEYTKSASSPTAHRDDDDQRLNHTNGNFDEERFPFGNSEAGRPLPADKNVKRAIKTAFMRLATGLSTAGSHVMNAKSLWVETLASDLELMKGRRPTEWLAELESDTTLTSLIKTGTPEQLRANELIGPYYEFIKNYRELLGIPGENRAVGHRWNNRWLKVRDELNVQGGVHVLNRLDQAKELIEGGNSNEVLYQSHVSPLDFRLLLAGDSDVSKILVKGTKAEWRKNERLRRFLDYVEYYMARVSLPKGADDSFVIDVNEYN